MFLQQHFRQACWCDLRRRWYGIIGCTFSMDCICSGNFDCSWSDGLCIWFNCKEKPTIVNLIVATVVVLAIKLVGYYLFEVLLTSSFVVPLASIPGNIMQIVTGAIIAIPIILVSRVGMAKVKRSMEA